MRPLLLVLPTFVLAACEPDPVGFDKYPVGSTAAALEAQQGQAVARRQAPIVTVTSQEMRSSNAPVSQNEAASRAMAERKSRDGIPLNAGGQSFTVTQVSYDGQNFLVAHADSASSSVDQSEALKSMADTVSGCTPSGPAWREGSSYAVALTCL